MKIQINSLMSLLLFATAFVVPAGAYSQDIGFGDDSPPVVSVQANFFLDDNGHSGELSVTATVRDGYHIYAMSQPKPFLATKISVKPSKQFELSDSFEASHPPQVHRHKSIDVELHEYEGNVTWTAPFKIFADIDPSSLIVTGEVYAQACYDEGCLPPQKYVFMAVYKPTRAQGAQRTSDQTGPDEQDYSPLKEASQKN